VAALEVTARRASMILARIGDFHHRGHRDSQRGRFLSAFLTGLNQRNRAVSPRRNLQTEWV